MFQHRSMVTVTLFLFLALPSAMLLILKGASRNWGGKEPFRTWTDSSGKFSAKARLQTDNGNAVVLQHADGRIINIPLAKLCAADQSYLAGGQSEDAELFRHSFFKYRYSNSGDLWAMFVNLTPTWLTLVIPMIVTGCGFFLFRRANA